MMGVAKKEKAHVQAFCHEICEGIEPVYLDTPTAAEGLLACFVNVEKRVSESGGSIQYGWRIWEWSNTMIEAEFHAVWVAPDGSLVDITPTDNGYQKTLFLPDPTREYHGRQVNNIRKPLFNNQLVTEFIELADEQFAIVNKGERAELNFDFSMTTEEMLDLQEKMNLSDDEERRLDFIWERKLEIQTLLSLCPCGSFLRFYRCCGK
jgi:hypothetical protein